jgi:precorrin-4/cobalt-precorrin-4 C11-methyltransferase
MKIYFVGAGPGDPELVTVKGARLLAEADLVVYAGSLVNPALLEGLAARLVDSNKINLEEINKIMIEALEKGERVVRLHSGDPAIYGAILEQMRPLEEAGVDV